jgi:hypothetical protein
VQFQGKLLTSTFLQASVAGPILGIDFLRKLKVIVSPEISWRFSHIHVDWWAHCSTVIVLITFLPLLITCPSGWKPSPS